MRIPYDAVHGETLVKTPTRMHSKFLSNVPKIFILCKEERRNHIPTNNEWLGLEFEQHYFLLGRIQFVERRRQI